MTVCWSSSAQLIGSRMRLGDRLLYGRVGDRRLFIKHVDASKNLAV